MQVVTSSSPTLSPGRMPATAPIVHVIDDDAGLRSALQRLLQTEGFSVATYAAAGDYLLPPPTSEPGCLLLDLYLPGCSGLDLQAALRHHPDYAHPIVFLSGEADIAVSVQAMRAGACEFLTKPVDSDVLLAAVHSAVDRDIAQRAERASREQAQAGLASLGRRERQVLQGIAAGRRHKQLAAELGVSERTIKLDRARIMARLGVRTLPALLRTLMVAETAPESR